MKKLSMLVGATLLALTVAACGSAQAAGGPGSVGSGAPAKSPVTAPASSQPAGNPGSAVTIVAKDIAFQTKNVTMAANTPTQVTFQNQDGAPHNVTIVAADGSVAFQGEVFNGPDQRVYQVPALAAGTYSFRCDVHPDMTGTLTVQ